MSSDIELLVKQVVALAWIRCVIEEGVDFIDKSTGKRIGDEIEIYRSFEAQEGRFDLPAAKGSRAGLEKNLLEIIGGYSVFSDEPETRALLNHPEFRKQIKHKIETIRSRG